MSEAIGPVSPPKKGGGRFSLSPLNKRRVAQFKGNRLAYVSLILFVFLAAFSMAAEFVANDEPLVVNYKGSYYFPIVETVPEKAFEGGMFPWEANFKDPFVQYLVKEQGNGWMLWPLIEHADNSYDTVGGPHPAAPSAEHWLGTDDQGRDVLARVLYGFRISILFAFALTAITTVIGVISGALQGYFGGWVDLLGQRILEIWSAMPMLYILMIITRLPVFEVMDLPRFFVLLAVMAFFGWMWCVGVVRAEFLRGRNYEYVKAARILGASDGRIMFRHILPNALVATIAMLPFTLAGSVGALVGLDFLGFGMEPGTASLGELALQAKNNLQAVHLGFVAFGATGLLLMLLVFIGQGVRDALDPRQKGA